MNCAAPRSPPGRPASGGGCSFGDSHCASPDRLIPPRYKPKRLSELQLIPDGTDARSEASPATASPAELLASAAFLLARLGMAIKARAIDEFEEAGFSPYHYSVLALLGEGARDDPGDDRRCPSASTAASSSGPRRARGPWTGRAPARSRRPPPPRRQPDHRRAGAARSVPQDHQAHRGRVLRTARRGRPGGAPLPARAAGGQPRSAVRPERQGRRGGPAPAAGRQALDGIARGGARVAFRRGRMPGWRYR